MRLARLFEYDGTDAPLCTDNKAKLSETEAPFEPLLSAADTTLPAPALRRIEDFLNRDRSRGSWVCRVWARGSQHKILLLRPSEGGPSDELVLKIATADPTCSVGDLSSTAVALDLVAAHGLAVPAPLATCCDLEVYPDCPGGVGAARAKEAVRDPGPAFLIEGKLEGDREEWLHKDLSDDEKALLSHEFARFVYELCSIAVPQDQGLGRLELWDGERFTLGRCALPWPPSLGGLQQTDSKRTAKTGPLKDDLDLIHLCLASSAAPAKARDSTLLPLPDLVDFLRPPASDGVCHRLVLSHLDLSCSNILTVDGHLTGVVGWDQHSVLPLYLAVQDPDWLQHDGPRDGEHFPLVDDDGRGVVLYPELPTVALRHRRDFQHMLYNLDKDLYHALTWGRPMRQLLGWLRGFVNEPWYADAFDKWRRHVQGFETLSDLVRDPIISGDALF